MQKDNTGRAFWLLAGPMMISNLSMALLGLVDTAVIGRLDSAVYLGGVAIGGIIFDFLYWGMGFLRMGATGLTAQARGQNDVAELRALLLQSALIGLGVALLILLLQAPIIHYGLALLEGGAEVKRHAAVYCRWMIWGAPALMLLLAINGWLLGMQNAMAALQIGVFVNVINIILDIILVIYLDMDVRGVALASVIAQYAGVLLALLLARRMLRGRGGRWSLARALDLQKLRLFLALNHDIFIRTVCIILVFAFFTREGGRHGDLVLAGNAILMKFYLLMAMALDGFNHAAEALVGRAVGAKSRRLFKRAVALTLKWSLCFGLFLTLFYWLSGAWLINLLTDIEPVRAVALAYLPWMIGLPLLSVWCFLLDGIFIGATRGAEMRNAMLICTFAGFLPVWYLCQPLGNHGLWLAFTAFTILRGAVLGLYYLNIARGGGFVRAG